MVVAWSTFGPQPSGPQQTPTDNAEAASTCPVSHVHRCQQRPIWLCQQEVAGSNLAVPPSAMVAELMARPTSMSFYPSSRTRTYRVLRNC
jgi:hypothetical protein